TSARPRPRERHSGATATDRSSALLPRTSSAAVPTIAPPLSATTIPGSASVSPESGRSAAVSNRSIAGVSSGCADRIIELGRESIDVFMRKSQLLGAAAIVAAAAAPRDRWLGGSNEGGADSTFHLTRELLDVETGAGQKCSRILQFVCARHLDARFGESRLAEQADELVLVQCPSDAADPQLETPPHAIGEYSFHDDVGNGEAAAWLQD